MKYRQIESSDELEVNRYYWWKNSYEKVEATILITPNLHPVSGYEYAGPIPTPEQMTEAQAMLYAMADLKMTATAFADQGETTVHLIRSLLKYLEKETANDV